MPRYRVLRDFESHLGNHSKGDYLTLADDLVARGFLGFVERVDDPVRKDIGPASERADDVPPEAGPPSSSASGTDRPEPAPSPTPAARAEAGYRDKMFRPAGLGHGHVRPRPDGAKARCGGPGLCRQCSKEAAQLKSEGR